MKRLLTADIHVGVASVSEDALIDVLRYMGDIAINRKCTHFDILGDLLNNRCTLSYRIWPKVKQFLKELADTGIEITILAGNHDFYQEDARGVESNLRHLSMDDRIRIIDQITQDNNGILWVPWLFPNEKIPVTAETRTVFGHLAINGFKLTHTHTEENGMIIPDMDFPVYTGHFHTPQTKGNIIYLGSPIHHNWNDQGDLKYAYIVDDTYQIVERIELNTQFVNLVRIDYNDISKLDLPERSKVQVLNVPVGNEQLVVKALVNKGALSVECTPVMKDDEDSELPETPKNMTVEDAILEQISVHDMKSELTEFHEILVKRTS